MNRRGFLSSVPLGSLSLGALGLLISPAAAKLGKVDVDQILNDPEAPVAGNPEGDVTIVAFLDYNCPYCKGTAADLKRIVATDGKIRLVYKDWPVLAVSSIYGARLALAARYQGKYQAAHDALMAIRGRSAKDEAMREVVEAAGVDVARLDRDRAVHGSAIDALIKRNKAQAGALGLQGTPVYLIGPYLVAQALNYEGFTEVVADFREHIRK